MAKKQGNGCIRSLEPDKPKGRCRKWKLTVSCGKDPLTGKYRQKNKTFTGSYAQAQKTLQILIEEIDSGEVVVNSTWTFRAYAEHFIEVRKLSGEVAEGTIRREAEKLDSLGFAIGDMKLQDITPDVIESALIDLRSGKSKSGKRLSGTYLNDICKKASLMFDHAVKNKIIAENPIAKVDKPKVDTGEKKSLDPESVHKLLGALNPAEYMECGVILATTLGLRRGEVVGLSWGDVNFKELTVHVRQTYDDAGNLNPPKTKASNRILPMSDFAYGALKARYDSQLAFLKLYGQQLLDVDKETKEASIKPSVPVISDRFGERIHPSGLGHWWYKHRADFGLEDYTLHNLRHTFLTLAAKSGVHPSVMQKLAGHSTARITMEVYTHANMDDKRAAMECLQEAFA